MWVVGGFMCQTDMDTNDLNHDLTASPWLPPTLQGAQHVQMSDLIHYVGVSKY